MNVNTLVTIFGGSGFLGRYVVRALAERHCRLRIAVRHPYFVEHLQRLGRPGQIRAIRADVRFPRLVEAAVRDAEIVINLVGILSERGEQGFDAVQGATRRSSDLTFRPSVPTQIRPQPMPDRRRGARRLCSPSCPE